MATTKICRGCGEEKELDEFHHHPFGKHQRQSWCKSCHNARTQENYARLPQTTKDRRAASLKARLYGMTLDELIALVEAHGNLCDICGKPEMSRRKRTMTNGLTMDHSHITGKFRGLLCSRCNTGISCLDDDPELLRKAISYLEER